VRGAASRGAAGIEAAGRPRCAVLCHAVPSREQNWRRCEPPFPLRAARLAKYCASGLRPVGRALPHQVGQECHAVAARRLRGRQLGRFGVGQLEGTAHLRQRGGAARRPPRAGRDSGPGWVRGRTGCRTAAHTVLLGEQQGGPAQGQRTSSVAPVQLSVHSSGSHLPVASAKGQMAPVGSMIGLPAGPNSVPGSKPHARQSMPPCSGSRHGAPAGCAGGRGHWGRTRGPQ
jgi:hypothetical protein